MHWDACVSVFIARLRAIEELVDDRETARSTQRSKLQDYGNTITDLQYFGHRFLLLTTLKPGCNELFT